MSRCYFFFFIRLFCKTRSFPHPFEDLMYKKASTSAHFLYFYFYFFKLSVITLFFSLTFCIICWIILYESTCLTPFKDLMQTSINTCTFSYFILFFYFTSRALFLVSIQTRHEFFFSRNNVQVPTRLRTTFIWLHV